MISVCFVCLGNICRSPTAEGVFLHLLSEENLTARIQVDSAGTCSHHVGESADRRSQSTANRRGFHLPSRSRQFLASDFDRFDYIVAMDASNMRHLLNMARTEKERQKVSLLRDHDEISPQGSNVPDPYYGGPDGFEEVFDLCFLGCKGLLAKIKFDHL